MKKKILSIAVAATMVFSLTACGTSNGGKEKAEESKTASAEEEKVIRVATAGNYAPFTIYDETKKEWSGFEIDLWNTIGEKTGYDIEFVKIDTPAAFAELDLERVDTIAKQITITEERKEIYNFSQPFFFSPYCLTVAESNTDITCWADMEGKNIGVKDGSADIEVIKANDPEGKVNIVLYEDDASCQRDVSLGRVDATVYASLVLPYDLEKQKDLKLKAVGTDEALYTEVDGYPFCKTERGDELRELTNQVLTEMMEDGSYGELSKKWFDIDIMNSEYAKEYFANNK